MKTVIEIPGTTLHNDGYAYEPVRTQAEVDEDLKELLKGSENIEVEIDMADSIVPGFREGLTLLPHQIVARKWMKERETGKKSGGILADDMGLGKTIQTLARIIEGRPTKSDREDGWDAPTLVVCPVGLMSQWASEINKVAAKQRVIQHHGPGRTQDPYELTRAHVVLTSYQVVANEFAAYTFDAKDESAKPKSKPKKKSKADDSDSDSDSVGKSIKKKAPKKKKQHSALFGVRWWRIVLDEAHNIKNKSTKAAIACCALTAKNRWALTGTPLQNNVDELYSFFNFLRIKPLNDWNNFKESISEPVKRGRTLRAMKRLHLVLDAIMLRRTKNTILNGKPILQLPDRIVEIIHCDFDNDERAFYNEIEEKAGSTIDKMIERGEERKNYTSMLILLLRLRQACNHAALITKDFADDADALENKPDNDSDDDDGGLAAAMGGLTVGGGAKCQLCQAILTSKNRTDGSKYCTDCDLQVVIKARRKSLPGPGSSSLPPTSAKIRKMLELLEDIRERSEEEDVPEKTIIFSQFTSYLDLIQPFLKDAGFKYVRYDGSMNPIERAKAIETIKTSRSTTVILISFKAGGTGLNLVACNNVILTDLWWNPALEDQAFDRAHRMGQLRNVNIYKLTIENTVEDRILELQQRKRELAAAALAGNKLKTKGLGVDELLTLFKHGSKDDDEEDD
ncbi:hypothetical protein SISNIDRAFT_418266 [Sistotremastrum niveocremeum HHB9708]|uniref:SNF2 family DNA-dependent ATPase domain-containing protein n=2 Tax=Sistotremastraceae TaxID=3402574 RepID=A0A164P5K9_9AGAM|nr:hypothetical protein SISNIDRAFT_418266 [Sistotremastrum niveocremeum HHB9708]KZT39699.1 hypothetical protein SISSUDRAFT_984420 [Sistotremastrum suecicum HHB10207 ss-3]